MDVVQLLIPADGVHIAVQAAVQGEVVALQGLAFPFSQRVDDLHILPHVFDIKLNRALHPVQVVVEAAARQYKQGGRHTGQIELIGKLPLKSILQQFDGDFGFHNVQLGLVPFWKLQSLQ